MKPRDAQRPSAVTNATGILTLNNGGRRRGVDVATYFRTEFFGRLEWIGDGVGKEVARFKADVVFDGEALGVLEFEVSHKPSRAENQGNTPTWLHWGSRLGAQLRKTDTVGWTVVIEAFADENYRIEISPGKAPPSIA
jgi:hypothetical protein